MEKNKTLQNYPECFGFRDEASSLCQRCSVNSKCLVFQQGTSIDVMGEAIKLLLAENNLLDALDSVHVQSSEDFIVDLFTIKIVSVPDLAKVQGDVAKTLFLLGSYSSLTPIKQILSNLPSVVKTGVTMDEASLYTHKLSQFGVELKLEKVKKPKKKLTSEFAEGKIIGHSNGNPVTAESLTHPIWISSQPDARELDNWKLVFKDGDNFSWIYYEPVPGDSKNFELACSCPDFTDHALCNHVSQAVMKGFQTLIETR